MGVISKAVIAVVVYLALPFVRVSAAELMLACTVREVMPTTDDEPYALSILFDGSNQTLLDVDGDHGADWVVDRFSETRIEAHANSLGRSRTLTIDRVTGVVNLVTDLSGANPIVLGYRGVCNIAKPKF